jgi:hypothetical protein
MAQNLGYNLAFSDKVLCALGPAEESADDI